MKYYLHVLVICIVISCVMGQYVLGGQKKYRRDSSERILPSPLSSGKLADGSDPLPGQSHVPPKIPEFPSQSTVAPIVSQSMPAQGQVTSTGANAPQMPGQVQAADPNSPQMPGQVQAAVPNSPQAPEVAGTVPSPQPAVGEVPGTMPNSQSAPGEVPGAVSQSQPAPGGVPGAVPQSQPAPGQVAGAVPQSQSAPGGVPGAVPQSQPAPGQVPAAVPNSQPVPDHILGTIPNSPTASDHHAQPTVLTVPPVPGVMPNSPQSQGHAPAGVSGQAPMAASNSPLAPVQAPMAAPNSPLAPGQAPMAAPTAAPNSRPAPSTCAPLNGRCWNLEDCCIGLGCISGTCKEGMQRNSKGEPLDHVEVIETEMSTGHNVDVSGHHNIRMLASIEECGQHNLHKTPHNHRHKRIVGGSTYELGKYPWLANLNLQFSSTDKTLEAQHCGGSIIGRRHILTVAHCATRIPTGFMLKYATLGLVDRRIKLNCEEDPSLPNCSENNFIDVEIEDIRVHERYSDAHVRNDIALIILKHDINYTDFIQPVCLPRSEKIFKKWHDGKMTVIGWGSQNTPTDTGAPVFSKSSQELDMILVHRKSCDRFFTRMIGKLRTSQICVVGPPGKADCAGDSGSPLFKKLESESDGNPDTKEERFFLFGLVSSGADLICGRQGKPSVFTNVIDYMPWILDHMLPNHEIVGEPVSREPVNPVDEFTTGFNMDVTTHRNVGVLPQFPNCGVIEGQQDHRWPATSTTGNKTQVKNRVKRIVGGIIQSIGAFPWLGQIILRNVDTTESIMQCGGALISSRHVLTAAHCIDSLRGPYAIDGVMLGNFNRMERKECIGNDCIEPQVIPIEEVFVHDGFTKYAREHDVALIKLTHEVKFSRFIRPICLPLSELLVPFAWPEPEIDTRYVAAGWGRVTSDDDPSEAVFSNLLIGANFTLESKKYCDSALVRKSGNVENARICGGGSMPGRGECIGDTGGPMMRWVTLQDIHGKWHTRMFAFGILSVVECAHQGIPSLYQNLLYHMPWIMDHLDS